MQLIRKKIKHAERSTKEVKHNNDSNFQASAYLFVKSCLVDDILFSLYCFIFISKNYCPFKDNLKFYIIPLKCSYNLDGCENQSYPQGFSLKP